MMQNSSQGALARECDTLGRMGKVGNLAGSAFVPLAAATGVVASAGRACASRSPQITAARCVTVPLYWYNG